MPSISTLKVLGALTITSFTALSNKKMVQETHKKNKKVPKLCDEIFDLCRSLRIQHWPKMDKRGVWETEQRMKYIEKYVVKEVIEGHTLLWLCRTMILKCQEELWNAGSTKGGAIDELIRKVEDLHSNFAGQEERHKEEAERMYEAWVRSLEQPLMKVS